MKLFDEIEAVTNVWFTNGPTDTSATAKLRLIYQFFDCLNVKSTEEHEFKSNKFLKPQNNVNDAIFAWLDRFLEYTLETVDVTKAG